MIHLDLFSGIGGFSYAADQIWENVEHIFVEYDPFCQAVLKKHWPDAEIHADIRQFVADAKSRKQHQLPVQQKQDKGLDVPARPYLLTGGFPCQPFSQAGRRKGTEDDRYLWPSMLECIALYHPRWIIAENVAGLVTWNDGVVLETVCTDLEKEGYEVQPFIIPAAAVGAPHRRDRVWIVAHCNSTGLWIKPESEQGSESSPVIIGSAEDSKYEQTGNAKQRRNDEGTPVGAAGSDTNASHSKKCGRQQRHPNAGRFSKRTLASKDRNGWSEQWIEVATRLCRVDDGIPRRLDRSSRLKALGNAIVPQVAAEIMRVIKDIG